MKGKVNLINLGTAFSLANLWFIAFWKSPAYPVDNYYYDSQPYTLLEYLAVFIDVLIVTGILAICIKLSTSSNTWLRRIFQIVFLILGLLAFCPLSREIIKWVSPETNNFINYSLPIVILTICVLFSLKEKKFKLQNVTEKLKLFALLLLPFSLLILLQLFWVAIKVNPVVFQPQTVEKEISANEYLPISKKVVWIIFDELDFAALTTAKQNNIELPDIDRLLAQSFVAENAVSPYNSTQVSIPALLTGKPLKSIDAIAANNLLLHPVDNSEPFTFRESVNVFSEVESLGGKSGIVGWYHPYPRIFNEKANYVYWSSAAFPVCSEFSEIFSCSRNIFYYSLVNVPFIARVFPSVRTIGASWRTEFQNNQLKRNDFLLAQADQLISNPKLDLLFFHFSIPHLPAISRIDLHGQETYFNSLEVVNDNFKKLRETLEKAGQWDNTVLIVSSDHKWRTKTLEDFKYLPEDQRQSVVDDTRIPYIVKFAGQQTRVDYKLPFNSIITKELISEVFKEKIKTPDDFILFLETLRVTQPDLINLQPKTSPASDEPENPADR